MNFKTWQIREGRRLYNGGAHLLSNTELVAHIIRDRRVAENLMEQFKCLSKIADASIDELKQIDGVGDAIAETLISGFEFGRRILSEQNETDCIVNPGDVYRLLGADMKMLQQEQLRVILLNTKKYVLKIETVFIGTLDASTVHPREIFKTAIRASAASIIIVHNHPTGNPKPSVDDTILTRQLKRAGELMRIPVDDHIIIGRDGYYSYTEAKLVWE